MIKKIKSAIIVFETIIKKSTFLGQAIEKGRIKCYTSSRSDSVKAVRGATEKQSTRMKLCLVKRDATCWWS